MCYFCTVLINSQTKMITSHNHRFEALCEVLSNELLNESYYTLTLRLPDCADGAEFLPGSFVQLKANAPNVFLRRPISVCEWNRDQRTLTLLIQCVGRGTNHFKSLSVGSFIDVVAPLGNSFDFSPEYAGTYPLLIGGGVGLAPMLMLARAFNDRGTIPHILIGARTADLLVLRSQFRKCGILHLTTDDGSVGVKGNVLAHPCLLESSYTSVYVCGPRVMMRAVAQWSMKRGIPTQISLENTMACGIGACLCCVEDTKDKGNVCVCTEGPVFNAERIKW